jgi:DNA polymerase-3 subunit gamma/tau
MALNCPERKGGEPCGDCESCVNIWSGRTSLDVVEIDAASNRGVDDARDLRERAMYAPSDESRYKVYIVDEAHMLTREAWNALLKILEEPPPRVIFVFATTEPQKIRQTAEPVLSRCQRFDFRRVSVRDLVERLRAVLEREGVSGEQEALLPIARRAEGGVRDALSLLDQVLSFSGDSVTPEDVRRMLGLVEEERYLELLTIVREGDRAAVFPFVQGLLDDGYDLAEFVQGLGDMLRAVLALRLDPQSDPAELSEDSRARLSEHGGLFSAEELLRLLVATADFESAGRIRRSAQPRVQVEVLLLRLASLDSSLELSELLEAMGSGVQAEPRRPSTATRKGSTPRSRPAAERVPRESPIGKGKPAERAVEQPPDGATAAPGGPETTAHPSEEETRQSGSSGGEEGELRVAWAEALQASRGSAAGGQLVGLRGANVKSFTDGEITLEVPPGLADDLEAFLSDPSRSAALRGELGNRLGTPADALRFRLGDTGPRRRITAESARNQKLQRMVDADPRLREAVETLDLNLTEE